jgi:hypothetical protein
MRTPCSSIPSLRDAIHGGGTPAGSLIGAEHRTALGDLLRGSALASGAENLRKRSVLIASADPFLVALALIELDGLARRLILYPPDLALEHLPYVMRYAEVDAVVSDGRFLSGVSLGTAHHAVCTPALVPRLPAGQERLPTEWVLLTSGTTGRPKMVLHTLASLAGAIGTGESSTGVIWGTFYDLRRYGGLQIYLRAVLTRSSLLLAGPREPVANVLRRAGEAGVTHISGTPSHWRRALMSPEAASRHDTSGSRVRSPTRASSTACAPSTRTPRSATPSPPRKPAWPSRSATGWQGPRRVCWLVIRVSI